MLLEIVPAGLPHSADMLLDNTDRIKLIKQEKNLLN